MHQPTEQPRIVYEPNPGCNPAGILVTAYGISLMTPKGQLNGLNTTEHPWCYDCFLKTLRMSLEDEHLMEAAARCGRPISPGDRLEVIGAGLVVFDVDRSSLSIVVGIEDYAETPADLIKFFEEQEAEEFLAQLRNLSDITGGNILWNTPSATC